MTQEDYIKTHPEQFKDDIDKWLFAEFGVIGGCCSAEKSHEYHIARMVAEKLTDVFIEKAWIWIEDNLLSSNQQDKSRLYFEQFKNYMKGE